MIRAGRHAIPATQTTLRHLFDDSRQRIQLHRLLRARADARRLMLALHAHHGKKGRAAARCGVGLFSVNTRSSETELRSLSRAAPGATLFSAAHAITQAPQPEQRSKSITMP